MVDGQRSTPSTHELGQRFEQIVALKLREQGWELLDRNVRFRRKEIDIVARRGRLVAFVEVKGRRTARFGDPLEAVTRRKRREITVVAR